jgi:hypothetical protein
MISVRELITQLQKEDQNALIVGALAVGESWDSAGTLILYVEGGEEENPIEIDMGSSRHIELISRHPNAQH